MKNILIYSFFLLFVVSSCNKDEFEKRPDWLSDKVNSVISNEDLCLITSVSVYKFEDEYYYDIYSQIWSCVYCHLYDKDGNEVAWNTETFNSFLEEKELINEYPACN